MPVSAKSTALAVMKRQAMYPFMVKHLKLDADNVLDKDTGMFDERPCVVETPEQMRVLDDTHPLPPDAVQPGAVVTF